MTKQKKLRYCEYYDMQSTFDRLYADSKQGKVFSHLTEIIGSAENIKLAYRSIKRNSGSMTAGTDHRNISDIERMQPEKLVDMIQRKLARYQPMPVRRVEIPKPDGRTRPLGIPSISDRIVQQCILQVMEPICEAKFHERSNGFRPNRSAENALAQCYKMIQVQNLHFVVNVDIKGFFDNVDHAKLIRQMWSLGLRDKKLICIIKAMLRAPVVLQNGKIEYPKKGTPQGGILSPLLANIVLNELDWWIASQWETAKTHRKYFIPLNANGSENKGYIYKLLKNTNLKEMYIVRYADDFKIFCRKRSDADKVFAAVKLWLKERLRLDVSPEKSSVVNLKKKSCDFLGFRLKAVKKRGTYAVYSNMTEKAVKRETQKLTEQLKRIRYANSRFDKFRNIRLYNSMVWGIHNYYRFATNVVTDCMKIQFIINKVQHNRLDKVERRGTITSSYIAEHYGKSKMLRFICGFPLCPIGYIRTKNPMYKKRIICKYTPEGRAEIHKNLKFDPYVMWCMHRLAEQYFPNQSIEYLDNRISKYAAQFGKCAVTGKQLLLEEIQCHHIKPRKLGGKDDYRNLVIVSSDIHNLIHATSADVIEYYRNKIKLNTEMLRKINKYRKAAGNAEIE